MSCNLSMIKTSLFKIYTAQKRGQWLDASEEDSRREQSMIESIDWLLCFGTYFNRKGTTSIISNSNRCSWEKWFWRGGIIGGRVTQKGALVGDLFFIPSHLNIPPQVLFLASQTFLIHLCFRIDSWCSSESDSWYSDHPPNTAPKNSNSSAIKHTVSTICSNVLGPAISPVLVTWPITNNVMSFSLAKDWRRDEHSRIWDTLPNNSIRI